MRIEPRGVLAGCLLMAACGAGARRGPVTAEPETSPGEVRHGVPPSLRPGPFMGGSSDGTTCEQARDQYTEEINLESGGPADLQSEDFAAVLNNGSYLNPCDVPSASHVRICAAVQNGRAVGVTVLLDPPNPSLEVCVAGQVRQLGFPPHPKMDVVNVAF